jgi:hypothetical protein
MGAGDVRDLLVICRFWKRIDSCCVAGLLQHVPRPILNRLRQVRRLDTFHPRHVRHRPRLL